MANLGLVLGVDIGGTNTAMGLVDREGCCLASASMPTQGDQPAAVFFQRLHVRAQALLDSLGTGVDLLAIGIGAPNALSLIHI